MMTAAAGTYGHLIIKSKTVRCLVPLQVTCDRQYLSKVTSKERGRFGADPDEFAGGAQMLFQP